MAPNLRAEVKRVGQLLNKNLELNSIQLAMLLVVLLIPVVLIVDSLYSTRYELQTNYRQLDDNQSLIEELASQNQALGQNLQEQAKLIEQQQAKIKELSTNNDELTGTLAATQDKLDKEQKACGFGDWDCYFQQKNDKKQQ